MVSRRAFLQSSAASVASLACGVSARADNAPGVTESEIKIIPSTAAEIAGGVGSLGAAAGTSLGAKALGLTAKTLPGMVAQGAASGAGIGALDSAARGGDPREGAIYGGADGAADRSSGRQLAKSRLRSRALSVGCGIH